MSWIRTQPLLLLFLVLGFFFGLFRSVWFFAFEALLLVVLRCCMHKACITSDAGVRQDTSPRFRFIITITLSFLGFWEWDGVPCSAPDIMLHRSVHSPPLSSGSRENHGPNGREWGGNRTVTQMLCTSVGQMQVVFLVRIAPVSSRNPV